MRQVVLDTETTGLSVEEGHRIIEIGCITLDNRRITDKTFHVYLNPDQKIERPAQEVHGITNQFLQDKPKFESIVDQFLAFIKDSELIIHNAPFDVGFLNHELQLCGFQDSSIEEHCRIIDTLALSRQKHPGQRNSLDALCKRYEIDNTERTLHGALVDADLLARVYLAMTGGQVAMALDLESQSGTQQDSADHKNLKAYSTPLLQPSTEELEAHNEFLEWMRAQFDQCVWDEF